LLEILLRLDVVVGRENNIELRSSPSQKGTVLETAPADLRDGANVVAYE
jgi:hypothetical protein